MLNELRHFPRFDKVDLKPIYCFPITLTKQNKTKNLCLTGNECYQQLREYKFRSQGCVIITKEHFLAALLLLATIEIVLS